MMGMLLPRVNTLGAVIGLGAGLFVFLLIRLLLPRLSPDALEQLGSLAGLKNNTWWDGMFTTIPAVVMGMLVSLLGAPPREDQLTGLLLRPSNGNK
jgi:Na+/proline symporter